MKGGNQILTDCVVSDVPFLDTHISSGVIDYFANITANTLAPLPDLNCNPNSLP